MSDVDVLDPNAAATETTPGTVPTPLGALLAAYRHAAVTEREKGTYFEELVVCYLRNEATYKDLYTEVWTYADWAQAQGLDKRDTGIDLVARTRGTNEFHAIQCKFYEPGHVVRKADIDSFFTASGKKPFTYRLIVTTAVHWSEHANDALQGQQPPVAKIDLLDLENSQIDWSKYRPKQAPALKPKKTLRPHQIRAVDAVLNGLTDAGRGKMIMACGTGKTFTSLKVAETVAGEGGRVLFLVPSLSLLSQTLTEWTQESVTPLHSFAVCSDSDVGNKRKKDDDVVQTFAHELRYPATTDAYRLALEVAKRGDPLHMNVVFSTYHSIQVISDAQKQFGLPAFDLIVCDEAHRTTGATFEAEEESAFVRVHDAEFIQAVKRLYMTATPRIFGDVAKEQADKGNVALCSMDDEALYGKELFVITFSEAVKADLLVDYKVLVLAVDEAHISRRLQNLFKDDDGQLKVEDAAKIVGCWKALSKHGTAEDLGDDLEPMRKAVAFCQVIEHVQGGKVHKVSSKRIAQMFQSVVDAYKANNPDEVDVSTTLRCEAAHVDGSMTATEKEAKLDWLKADAGEDTCRILSNVRCLSEGVDVPALDAVLFLTPRNSQIDVVQSVGRVMRKSPGKKRGYVVLPIVIPAGVAPEEALSDNKTYRVVWQVLQALRSHDDRFDAMVNKLDLIGKDVSRMEVIAVTEKLSRKAEQEGGQKKTGDGHGSTILGTTTQALTQKTVQQAFQFEIGELERAIYAKVVQKCGNRRHWEEWANDIAKIARTHITRIRAILDHEGNVEERAKFQAFAEELRDDLNDSITDDEIIEMLAQHLITKPVFDALFADYSFASHNPISVALEGVLKALQEHQLENEADTLQKFYASVKMRAAGVDSAEGKQKIIVELYDKFFRNAFPRMTERLGIVYTPVEIVDFIIRSVDHILRTEFGQSLGSDGVHILDPFTGTGTFITRLMQSGLLSKEELRAKYKHQIHANEIVLLAYYIAAVNIEAAYHSIVGGEYVPFEGICLTDTFQLYEKGDMISNLLVSNSTRRARQKELDIRVIVGNPPYSKGQDSANDNNQNVEYPHLDGRIRKTYADRSAATNKNSLYDSYIRAIRWASDRVGESGVIGFVTNAGFLESTTADGLRRALSEEFSGIYVLNLRGNQRTSGEQSRKEGGKVFGSGSRAPIAITLLVKNPLAVAGRVVWHDIGDYLTRAEKLERVRSFGDVRGIECAGGWRAVTPDAHGDWFGHRLADFSVFLAVGDKKSTAHDALFANYSSGIKTNRDAWCYNGSAKAVVKSMQAMIGFYNTEVDRFRAHSASGGTTTVEDFVSTDATKISWNRSLRGDLGRHRKYAFEAAALVRSVYRPYFKQWLYFSRSMNNDVAQMPRIFPSAASQNHVIMVKQNWSGDGQLALMVDCIPEMQTDGGTQCFPLYLYDTPEATNAPAKAQGGLFDSPTTKPTGPRRRDAITDAGLAHFQAAYPGEKLRKEDLFYYVYGLLHSPDYRERYADNLSKELPRIPCVKSTADFWAFSKAGRALADLHVNYETVAPYPATLDTGLTPLSPADYRVEKMRYAKSGKDKDLTTLHYNARITVRDIPVEAYEYVVNGKPALDWVVERQCVKTDPDSGIVNDANDWAVETMGNPRYPLELFLRVITVSLETMKIVKGLPALDI
jgi:predicted helicase